VVNPLLTISIKGRAGSLLGLVALLALSSTAVVTGLNVHGSTSSALARAAREGAAPDLVLWGRSSALHDAAADSAIEVSGAPRALASVEVVEADGGTSLALLSVIAPPNESVGRLLLSGGRRPVEALTPAEAVVERGMGSVGQTLTIRRDGKSHKVRVVGVGTDLTMCGAPTCRPGRLFVSAPTFSALTGSAVAASDQSQAFMLRDGAASAQDVGSRLIASLPGRIFRQITWATTRSALLGPDTYLGGFVGGVGVFLLLASLVVIAATVTAQLAGRRCELATYATLGMSPGRLLGSLLAELVIVGMAGTTLGWLLASELAPWTRGLAAGVGAGATPRDSLQLHDLAVATALVLTGLTLATGVSIVRAARQDLVPALRDEVVGGQPRGRAAFRARGVVVPLGLQDPFTRPLRSVFCVLGLVLATAGAVVGVGVLGTVNRLVAPETRPTPRRDLSAWATDGRTADGLAAELRSVPGVAEVYTERTDPARPASPVAGTFTAIAEGGPLTRTVHVVEGRSVRHPDEALVGYGLSDRFGWHIGDRVQFDVAHHVVDVTLVGMYRDITDGGAALRYRLEQLHTVLPDASAGVVSVIVSPQASKRLVRTKIQLAAGDGVQVFESGDPSWLAQRATVVIALTIALLGAVALLQIGAAWLTSLREQRRDLFILRSMGAKRHQLIGRSVVGGLVVGVVAVVVGLPLGSLVLQVIARSAVDGRGLGPGVISTPGPVPTTVISLAVSLLAVMVAVLVTVVVLTREDTTTLRNAT
jgi:putative ABC transport system permease protein